MLPHGLLLYHLVAKAAPAARSAARGSQLDLWLMLCSALLILNKVDFSDLPHQYDWKINIKQEGQSNLAMDARGASAVSHLECRKTRIKLIGNPPATGVQRCVKLLGYFSASRSTKVARTERSEVRGWGRDAKRRGRAARRAATYRKYVVRM